ncbi:MAG: TIGR00725 family protein [Nitrososphaeria archaeon]|nr:TIGR00725 family protein [Nitrososphaeria archaeon]
MTKKRQILVIGNNENGSTPELEKIAYAVGVEVAKTGAVLITGGLGGVMKAASHGAHDSGGLVVGIIPQDNQVIIVGGGSGTLSETCAAYMHKKPIAALRNSGGTASKYADQYLDHRQNVKIVGVDTPKEAVDYIQSQIIA